MFPRPAAVSPARRSRESPDKPDVPRLGVWQSSIVLVVAFSSGSLRPVLWCSSVLDSGSRSSVLRSSLARMMYSARTRLLSSVHKDVINVSLAICHADDLRTWTLRRQLTRQSISFQPTKTFLSLRWAKSCVPSLGRDSPQRDQRLAPHDAHAQFVRRDCQMDMLEQPESPLDVQTPSLLLRMLRVVEFSRVLRDQHDRLLARMRRCVASKCGCNICSGADRVIVEKPIRGKRVIPALATRVDTGLSGLAASASMTCLLRLFQTVQSPQVNPLQFVSDSIAHDLAPCCFGRSVLPSAPAQISCRLRKSFGQEDKGCV